MGDAAARYRLSTKRGRLKLVDRVVDRVVDRKVEIPESLDTGWFYV